MNDESRRMESAIRKSNIVEGIRNVTHLGEGGYSDTYRLDTHKNSYVIKIRMDKLVWRLQREYTLLSHKEVVKRSLGPKVYRFDKSGALFKLPYLLEEYVEGTHPKGNWGKKSRIDLPFVRTIARWYRQLHSITIKDLKDDDPAIGVFDWNDEVRRINSISYFYTGNPDGMTSEHHNPDPSQAEDARDNEALLSAEVLALFKKHDSILQRDVYNLIQCDPSPDNIFIQENGSVKVVDWDFAGYHVFERDLALFIYTYNLTKEQEQVFLESYGIQPDAGFLRKLNVVKLLLFAGGYPPWFSEKQIRNRREKNYRILREVNLLSNHIEASTDGDPSDARLT